MVTIVLVYLLSVLMKWAYEALDWMGENKKTWREWWQAYRLIQIKKAILHGILCAGWASGALLGTVNVVMKEWGMEPLAAVTWQSTLAAGFMLDTLQKPLAKRLKRKEESDL